MIIKYILSMFDKFRLFKKIHEKLNYINSDIIIMKNVDIINRSSIDRVTNYICDMKKKFDLHKKSHENFKKKYGIAWETVKDLDRKIDDFCNKLMTMELLNEEVRRQLMSKDEIDNIYKEFTLKDKKLNHYLKELNVIETLSLKAKKDYNVYIQYLKDEVTKALDNCNVEITETISTHQVPRRLASLETRITKLEQKPHGSGEAIPGQPGTNKD